MIRLQNEIQSARINFSKAPEVIQVTDLLSLDYAILMRYAPRHDTARNDLLRTLACSTLHVDKSMHKSRKRIIRLLAYPQHTFENIGELIDIIETKNRTIFFREKFFVHEVSW